MVKRIFIVGLVLCLLFTGGAMGTVSVTAEDTEGETAPAVMLGDTDGDGAVTMKDVLLVRRYIARMIPTIDTVSADVDCDGAVSMKDVLLIRRFVARVFRSFEGLPKGWQHKLTSEFVFFRAGYEQLDDAEKAAYDETIKAIEAHMDEDTKVAGGKPGLSVTFSKPLPNDQSVSHVFRALYADQPEFYFLDNSFSYSRAGNGTITALTLNYTMDLEKRQVVGPELIKAVDSWMAEMGSAGSTFDKELWIHDKLCTFCEYPEGDPYANTDWFSPYGALVLGTAVCDGYARTMQLLCLVAEIPATVVEGFSFTGAAHMWNVVYLSDHPYFVDPTWDDSEFGLSHAYFNVTTDDLQESHTMNFDFPLPPDCKDTKENYYIRTNRYLATDDEEAFSGLVRNSYQAGEPFAEMRCAPEVMEINRFRTVGGDLCALVNDRLLPGQRQMNGYIYTFFDSVNVIAISFG